MRASPGFMAGLSARLGNAQGNTFFEKSSSRPPIAPYASPWRAKRPYARRRHSTYSAEGDGHKSRPPRSTTSAPRRPSVIVEHCCYNAAVDDEQPVRQIWLAFCIIRATHRSTRISTIGGRFLVRSVALGRRYCHENHSLRTRHVNRSVHTSVSTCNILHGRRCMLRAFL